MKKIKLIAICKGSGIPTVEFNDHEGKKVNVDKIMEYIYNANVNAKIVEFTGQQDKDGDDIYDDFIMETPGGERYKVEKEWYLVSDNDTYNNIMVDGYYDMRKDKIIGTKRELLNKNKSK